MAASPDHGENRGPVLVDTIGRGADSRAPFEETPAPAASSLQSDASCPKPTLAPMAAT